MKPLAGICFVIGLAALGYAFFASREPIPQTERGLYEDLDFKAVRVAGQIVATVVGFIFIGTAIAVQWA